MPVLTAASVQKYKADPSKRREIPDAKATGLYLMIQPSGAKAWALRFRRPDGRPAKLTLGPVDFSDEMKGEPVIGQPLTLAAARQLAATVHRDRVRGIDVVEAQKAERLRQQVAAQDRVANNFAASARQFFAEHKIRKHHTRPRRWREDAALFGLRYPLGSDPATTEPEVVKGGLADVWRNKPVADIDGADIDAVVSEAGSESRGRKLHTVLSALFKWLRKKRRVTTNPVTGADRPDPPKSRDRIFDDTEIVTFWKACDLLGPPFGPLAKLLLITGSRLREVSGMRQEELANGDWTIPGHRSKNHLQHLVPLPPLALEIIKSQPMIGSTFIFTRNGRSPVTDFSKAKRDLDAAMAKVTGHPVKPWRLHDLRRSMATGLASLGVQPHIIEACLNHTSGTAKGGVAGVYNRFEYAGEKRAALARWAQHVQQGLVAPTDKVVPMRQRGKP